jgi:cell wall-associated NlpC family hydrolase
MRALVAAPPLTASTLRQRQVGPLAGAIGHHFQTMRRPLAVLLAAAVAGAALAALVPTAGSATDARPSVREAALAWALAQDGTQERGTTNCSPKIDRWQRDMGLKVPPCRVWCGAFVHQAYKRAGVKLSARMIDPDRAYDDAIAGRRHLRRIAVSAIRPGDIVFYKFRDGVRASHLALARARPRNGSLDTVEGNTSNAVRLETRGTRYIVLAARVTA